MTSRLEDLLATAERQFAARSYDAAIDSYRTALGEPYAAEAGVAELLAKATRSRDEARGVAPAEMPAVAVEEAPPLPACEEPAPTAVIAPVAERIVEEKPIAPPTFQLLQSDRDYAEQQDADLRLEVEKLSILNPSAPPESTDQLASARLIVALVIAAAVFAVAVLLK
ncbi:MAG TPA: hypothetical protein VHW09_11955 [Bryobacteraceae bacterium]|jgi:hypothetical protein|nr:hypothetical protein [Bryobacteraceae bacterium]